MMKALGKVMIVVLLAIAFLVPDRASAATKEETRLTELYKNLQHGMTIEQVATTLYGKKAKKHIRYRKVSCQFYAYQSMTKQSKKGISS